MSLEARKYDIREKQAFESVFFSRKWRNKGSTRSENHFTLSEFEMLVKVPLG